jgi:diaminopimelate epimerase
MKILFNKYEGAGNDFIIVRNSSQLINHSDKSLIKDLCDRRFGIGADGLMLIEDNAGSDFRMIYYNADGSEGEMCGNGARCAAHFAMSHMTGFRDLTFMAGDGPHTARPDGPGRTEISIRDVTEISEAPDGMLVNTGVPHLVVFTRDCGITDVVKRGRKLRHSPSYAPAGVNVNFATVVNGKLHVRTYERGVEDETLACGTGITATAIAAARTGKIVTSATSTGNEKNADCTTEVVTRGGILSVKFRLAGNGATGIFLAGPATFVFSGEIEI